MKDASYETVTTLDKGIPQSGKLGRELYQVPKTLQLWFALVTVYALVAVGFMIFVLTKCPTEGPALRVLPEWSSNMNQFYSGLVLSLIFTPAALLVRRLANDIALLHLFALAFTTPVEIGHLEVLADPGLFALRCLFRYSKPRALVQAVLMITGAFIVPVGTLLAYPGIYHEPRLGVGLVGMPIVNEDTGSMVEDMSTTGDSIFETTVTSVFRSDAVKQVGYFPALTSILGVQASPHKGYDDQATYHGVLSFPWSSGCHRTEDIRLTFFNATDEEGLLIFDVTGNEEGHAIMPDGTTYDFWTLANSLRIANTIDAINGSVTTYFLSMGLDSDTYNYGIFEDHDDDFDYTLDANGDFWWISRVACTPSLEWQTSSCSWNDTSKAMEDCEPMSLDDWDSKACKWKGTVIESCQSMGGDERLDEDGLDLMNSYMSTIPLRLSGESELAFGRNVVNMSLFIDPEQELEKLYIKVHAPDPSDFNNFYGYVAKSLVYVATSGYYGLMKVPYTGYKAQARHLVRVYILAIVVAMLVLSAALPMLILLWSYRVHRVPIRSTTFFTIANAVRGSWWDETLFGTCLMKPTDMKDELRGLKVRFGVIPDEGTEVRDLKDKKEHADQTDQRDQEENEENEENTDQDSSINKHPPDYRKIRYRHVGFAPEVEPVKEDVIYSGVTVSNIDSRGKCKID